MARENVDSLIDELYDFSTDISSIPQDNKLSTFIIGLEQLANDASAFGGKIAQICPAKIRQQKDLLENLLRQLSTACKNASDGLTSLAEMLENMPLKELRGVLSNPAKAKAQLETSVGIDQNGVAAQTPVITPGGNTSAPDSSGPKSEMLKNESTVWNNLKGQFKFTEGQKTGFDWSSISNNVEQLGIDVSDTIATPQMTLFESIMSNGNIPKSAGDLNSKPDTRDNYDYNEAYSDVLPGETSRITESINPSVTQPIKESKPKSINEEAHELFENVSPNESESIELTEALSSFKNKAFDFSDIEENMEWEYNDQISIEDHIID